mmetsp:Transcript_42566/g.78922  ORF Transcript_42566/g.78922 Transcript_42566/m.78922 type:complete len:339 (+) Transcript_42566:180-1196(+)
MAWWKMGGPSAREEQMVSFEQSYPSARKTHGQNSCHYDLTFSTCANAQSSMLRVFLPPRFPEEQPILQLLTRIAPHPWINTYNQVIGHPFLKPKSWRKEFELSILVQQVIAEFGRAALTPSEYASPETMHRDQLCAPPSYDVLRNSGPTAAATNCNSLNDSYEVPTPTVPLTFSELDYLDFAQLTQLIADDAAFHNHVNKLPVVKMVQELRRDAVKANHNTAHSTLARRVELLTLRAESVAIKMQLRGVSEAFEEKLKARKIYDHGRFSQASILKFMRSAAMESEVASEELNERFCNKEIEVGNFVKKFQHLRQQYHQRHACVEMNDQWVTNSREQKR